MSTFKTLFGIEESEVKETCILTPLVTKDNLRRFGVEKFSHGKLYNTGGSEHLTLIRTGVGTPLLGDAVLYLEETPCKHIILFGSCGLIRHSADLTIGNLVSPVECHACESFIQVLQDMMENLDIFYPDESLLEEFFRHNKDEIIKRVHCVTFGSLKMEEEKLHFFGEQEIDVVDMECSAFFAASRYINRRAMALLYITDIVDEQPFYKPLLPQDKTSLISSINYAIDILCNFAETLRGDTFQ